MSTAVSASGLGLSALAPLQEVSPIASPGGQRRAAHAQSQNFSAVRSRLLARFSDSGVAVGGDSAGAGAGLTGLSFRSAAPPSAIGLSALGVGPEPYTAGAAAGAGGVVDAAASGPGGAVRVVRPVSAMVHPDTGVRTVDAPRESLGALRSPEQRLDKSRMQYDRMVARMAGLPPGSSGAVGVSPHVATLRAQLKSSQRLLAPPAPPPRPPSSGADDLVGAAVSRGSDKDAIIRHLRKENERLDSLVQKAVEEGQRLTLDTFNEQQLEIDKLRAENERLVAQLHKASAMIAEERRNVRFAVNKLQRLRARGTR